MINYRSYVFKKVYLDDKIFEFNNSEIKIGYLNINGLTDGNHDHYFNADKNLNNLDLIVLAETKLGIESKDETLENILNNWNIIGRYDSDDQMKHMGLILLKSKKSKFNGKLIITHQTAKRNGKLQIEGVIVRTSYNLIFGFIYCRSAPNDLEIKAINKYFGECNTLMGDLNLSHRIEKDQSKVSKLCQNTKVSALNEITRSISNNQLDYILMDEILRRSSFVTSYHNFISDHKSITARVGLNGNQFTCEFKVKLTFDRESHKKSNQTQESEKNTLDQSSNLMSDHNSDDSFDSNTSSQNILNMEQTARQVFARKFQNVDMATCWLNSCLQLILAAFDHLDSQTFLTSELGIELMQLMTNEKENSLDPTIVKNIIVTAEDTRIALRLSELATEIRDQAELEHRTEVVKQLRLNLLTGQQCVRDFFLCLQENAENWPDVCAPFYFKITHSTKCCSCSQVSKSETNQMYVELPVPPGNTALSESVQASFNASSLVGRFCDDGCHTFSQAKKYSKLTLAKETEFFIIILSRAVETFDGFKLIERRTVPTNDVLIRYT